MSDKITKYAISHKNFDDPRFRSRTVLYVNHNIPKTIRENEKNDWSQDNIDSLNPWYCELTALYWIWKNDRDSQYVSFEHYRRVFLTSRSNWFNYRFLEEEEMEKMLKEKKIVLPLLHHFEKDIYSHYKENHVESDLTCMGETIHQMFPEYDEDFKTVMVSHDIVLFNMFIMKKEDMDSYCSFAFPVLDEVFRIQKEDILKRDSYQQRSIGFLSERLFNVWIRHHFKEEEIFHCPIAHLDQKPLVHYLKDMYFRLRRKDYDGKWSRL